MAKRRVTKNVSKKAGMKPGSLVHIGEFNDIVTNINLVKYNLDTYTKKNYKKISECLKDFEKDKINWIDINGLSDVKVVEDIGKYFNLSNLLLEDILNTTKRPKFDQYDNCIFIILKIMYMEENSNNVSTEQLSLVIGENFLISFSEKPSNNFDCINKRIQVSKGPFKKMGVDYLAYAIIDTVVDNYFVVFENIEDNFEAIEEELVSNPDEDTLKKIYGLKRELIYLRKSIWPLREVINSLTKEDTIFLRNNTTMYIKDVYDHIIEINDTLQLFVDGVSNMLDIYLSSVSNKMNEIMKVLTIFSTMFIPLTFIVGIYGMNFDIPELKFKYGYETVWVLMIVITIYMIRFFKRKKWF